MSFEHVRFLSKWAQPDPRSMAMVGRKAALEIENNGGDLLILEYAFPGLEEERGVSVTLRVFDSVVGQFRRSLSLLRPGSPRSLEELCLY